MLSTGTCFPSSSNDSSVQQPESPSHERSRTGEDFRLQPLSEWSWSLEWWQCNKCKFQQRKVHVTEHHNGFPISDIWKLAWIRNLNLVSKEFYSCILSATEMPWLLNLIFLKFSLLICKMEMFIEVFFNQMKQHHSWHIERAQ